MKRITDYVIAGLSAITGVLMATLGLVVARGRRQKEQAQKARARADLYEKNAQALKDHAEQVEDVKRREDEWDAKVQEGFSDDALADVISANNKRVSKPAD